MPESELLDDEEPGGGLAYDLAKWQLDDQSDRFRVIHARLAVTAAINSVVIGLFAIAFALLARDPAPPELALAATALIVFLASVGCTTAALQMTRPQRGPTAGEVLKIERDLGEALAHRWVAREMSRAFSLNEPVIAAMQRWSRAAQLFAAADAAFAVATVLVVLFA